METIKTFPIKGGGVQCVKKIILVQKHCIKPFSVFFFFSKIDNGKWALGGREL